MSVELVVEPLGADHDWAAFGSIAGRSWYIRLALSPWHRFCSVLFRYLWAVVAAHDLGFISRSQAGAQIAATLTTVSHLKRYDGFLYQWYDTTNGNVISDTNNTAGSNCATEDVVTPHASFIALDVLP